MIGWGADVLLIAGLWMVGNRRRSAFLLSIVGESVWVVNALARREYDLAAICVVFGVLAFRSWLLWGKDK